ncbi:MAG: pitrilysin family protein [Candidatus Lustribacter sp.]|jgi:zinc protease
MSPFRRLFACAAGLTLLFAPLAAQPQEASGAVPMAHATLANGLQVYVLQDRLSPVVSMYTNYLAGANDEPVTGLAHAQEHMMFRGSKTIDASQFSDTTAITGGSYNADTQNEITQFFFEMPAQYLDIALNLERSRATGILDAQSGWNAERGAITQEVVRDNSSASYRLYVKMIHHILAGTPYADEGLGTVEEFKKIQAPDLKRFYARWYHPNNAIMVIAGDVDPQATIAKVRALFGSIPSAPLPARKPVHLEPLTPLTLRDNSSDPITLAMVGYRVPGYNDRDYYASEILNDVLNSPRGALYALQASGKSLGTWAQSSTHPAAGLSIVGSAVPVTTSGDTAAADVKAVIEGYKQTGLPPELVAVAKARELAQAQSESNSINGLASLWSQELAVEHRTPGDELAGLEKVTVDDVNRVLRTYYDNATATVAIATPKAASGSAFGGREGENNSVPPTSHTALPAFARNVLAQLHVPESSVHPVEQTLPNGIHLITVQSAISPTVVVRGEIRTNADVQAPAGKDGIDGLLNGLFEYGTTTYDRIAYQTELDKIAADVSAGSAFSLDTLAQNFDRGVTLLADDELHPALPADAFAIVKQQTIGQLTGAVQGPEFKAQRALADALYPAGDPSRRYATPQTVGSITLDDVKAYYASTFRPDLTTIVVVGDVTPQHAQATIQSAFGAWTATGPVPDVYPPAVPRNAPSQAVIPATGRIQADVTLAQTLPLTYNDPDYPVLQLANAALSGGFGSILYYDVRQIHGYVYSVDSAVAGGHNRSTFRVTYGAFPQNTMRAQNLIVTDLTALQKKPLTPDRLIRAKALLLGRLPVRSESYDGVASTLLTYAATGRPLDSDRRYARAEFGASADAVRAAMAKWIRPNDFAKVMQVPAGR